MENEGNWGDEGKVMLRRWREKVWEINHTKNVWKTLGNYFISLLKIYNSYVYYKSSNNNLLKRDFWLVLEWSKMRGQYENGGNTLKCLKHI